MSRLPRTAPTRPVPARVSPATATIAAGRPVVTNVPAWAAWRTRPSCGELTIGIEEEFMLLEPERWSLAFRSDEVLAALPAELRDRVTLETHAAVMEIATGVHRRIGDAVTELVQLRVKSRDVV